MASLAGQAEEPARSFARTRLLPAWARVAENVRSTLAAAGADPASVLGQAQRCLSPSDFGFHNALARDDWKRALEMYRLSTAIWKVLRERGVLAEPDAAKFDAVNREIARCSAALGS